MSLIAVGGVATATTASAGTGDCQRVSSIKVVCSDGWYAFPHGYQLAGIRNDWNIPILFQVTYSSTNPYSYGNPALVCVYPGPANIDWEDSSAVSAYPYEDFGNYYAGLVTCR